MYSNGCGLLTCKEQGVSSVQYFLLYVHVLQQCQRSYQEIFSTKMRWWHNNLRVSMFKIWCYRFRTKILQLLLRRTQFLLNLSWSLIMLYGPVLIRIPKRYYKNRKDKSTICTCLLYIRCHLSPPHLSKPYTCIYK